MRQRRPLARTNDLLPISTRDWTYATAAHLIERAGFGATPDDIVRLAAMTPQQVVDRLADYEAVADTLKPFDESVIWDPGMDGHQGVAGIR